MTLLPPAACCELRLLGTPAWRGGSHAPWQPLAGKDALLLAALVLDGAQARAPLAARLWPGVPAPRANANLRQRLFRLRRAGARLVHEDGEGLRLEPTLRCDLLPGEGFGEAGLSAPLLEGVTGEGDEALARWLDDARRLWAVRRPERLAELAARHEADGELEAALSLTQQLLADEPLQEHGWRRLMQLHLARGDRAAALAAFERCEQVLRDELGVRPSPATLALLHRAETLQAGAPASAASGLPAVLLRPLPFTGREAERRAMAAAWAAGGAFVLVGEAGQGKSRLLGGWAARQPGCVLESARPGDEFVAYGSLVRLLRALHKAAPRPEALWPDSAARRELARLLPELGAAPPSPGLEALLHDAVERTLAQAAGAGVQAVLLDDLQHADEATLALLPRLLATPGLRWGLATRPGPRPDLAAWLAASSRLVRVNLAPLSAAELRQLLQALELPVPALVARADELARHSGGNPLFLLETLKHLALHGGLPPDGPLPLPATVQALLADRLAALPPEALALARVAAVAGADFDAEVACSVLQQPALALAAPWQALQQAQVLDGEAFTHDAVRDAVLAGLPEPLRAPLHAGIGACLQARGRAPERAAHHFAAGRRWAEAAAAALQAAEAARRVGRPAERLAALQRAATAADCAGDADTAFRARLAAVPTLHAQQGLAAAQQAIAALAPAAGHPALQLALHLERAELALAAYELPALQTSAQAALAVAAPGSAEERLALGLQACALARGGDDAEALAHFARLMARLERDGDGAAALPSWTHAAVVLHHTGRGAALAEALETQRRLAHEIGHAEMEASALASLAAHRLALGEPERSVAEGREAVALQRRIGAHHLAVMSEINLAIACVGTYRLLEAQALLAPVSAHVADTAAASELPHIVADLRAELWLRLGDPARALREGEGQPLAALSPVRRLNRLVLHWRAGCALGEAGLAAQALGGLREALPAAGQGSVWMRALAMEALASGPGAAAEAALEALALAARKAAMPAAEALHQQAVLRLALQGGEVALALAAARRLQALRDAARHLFVDEAELRADVGAALLAAGLAADAEAWRAESRRWARETVLPALPASHRGLWAARPELSGWV